MKQEERERADEIVIDDDVSYQGCRMRVVAHPTGGCRRGTQTAPMPRPQNASAPLVGASIQRFLPAGLCPTQ